jgi:predicted ATPase
VTLAGAGGSGKTRLALALAESCGDLFANGVALVELGALREPALVLPAVAQALGVSEEPGKPLERTVGEWLADRELLVVVDNLEHLVGAEHVLASLVAAGTRNTLVVTSQRVLHLSGEHVFPVQPLPEDDAVSLFTARATALDPDFSVAPEEAPAVHEICRRLDGLPLAIELAAARTRTLTVAALLERLSERLALLTSGPHDLPARQRTLRDALEWSSSLLGAGQRHDLARLAVFARGCTLEAAETVCETNLDGLTTLVDQSLVRRDLGAEEPRFSMLETVREFARELLEAEEDVQDLESRHALFYVELAERAESELGGEDQARWLARLEAEHDECRLALARLARAGEAALELRLAAALGRFRYVRGYLSEGRAALEEALEHGPEELPAIRAKALRVTSAICILQGDYTRARELAEAGLALYRSEGDRNGVARTLSNLGAVLVASGESHEAAEVLDEAVVLARSVGDERVLALALNNRGDVALIEEDWSTASELFSESLELLRRLGDETNVARSLFNLGAAELERGRDDEAAALLADSLQRCVELDDKEDIAWCLVALAALAERGGDPERGGELLGAAERLLEGMGAILKPYERRLHERTEEAIGARLGEERLDALRESGRELGPQAVLARA